MHGIFPTHNKYYIAHEIFPHLSRKEKKEVYFPDKVKKFAADQKPAQKSDKSTEDFSNFE